MRKPLTALAFALAIAFAPNAATPAGIPVIDVTAIANLIEQITYWQQQMTAMAQQLHQLQQTHAAQTGDRGMQNVLPVSNQERNYLPPDYAELMRVVSGTSPAYVGLSAQIQSVMRANARLSNAQLNAMPPEARQGVESSRRSAALMSTLTQAAYQQTSTRFAALEQLVTAIGRAPDAKAIQDLQVRVNTEQAMLQNENLKLQTLYQLSLADQRMQQQRERERSLADVGSITTLSSVSY
jgi:type IV secretion system protein VirB5